MSEDEKAPRFGPQGKLLSELSDAELQAEAQRRRRRRGTAHAPREDAIPASSGRMGRREIAQLYANLELPPGATRSEVEAAYARLSQTYAPALQAKDPERQEAARQLAASLKQAYEKLLGHLNHVAE